jgi:hypothetical protein
MAPSGSSIAQKTPSDNDILQSQSIDDSDTNNERGRLSVKILKSEMDDAGTL